MPLFNLSISQDCLVAANTYSCWSNLVAQLASLCHCHSGGLITGSNTVESQFQIKTQVNKITVLMYHNEQQTYLMNYFQKNKFQIPSTINIISTMTDSVTK